MIEVRLVNSAVVRSRIPLEVYEQLVGEAANEERTISNMVAKILRERYYPDALDSQKN